MFNKEFNQNRTVNAIKCINSKNGVVLNNNKSKAHAGKNRRGSKPIGTERVRKGYVEIKVKQPNVWNQKHRHIWETYYKKKIKNDEVVVFLDKDNRNFNIDNLALVHRGLVGLMNINGWFSEGPELTKLGIATAKVVRKTCEREQNK